MTASKCELVCVWGGGRGGTGRGVTTHKTKAKLKSNAYKCVVFTSRECLPCRGEIFSHTVYLRLTLRSYHLNEADLRPRPSMHIHSTDKSSGQTNQFNIWTIWAMDRTSAQPQVNLSLLRSNSLKFQPKGSQGTDQRLYITIVRDID
jgi:hypothetical protein